MFIICMRLSFSDSYQIFKLFNSMLFFLGVSDRSFILYCNLNHCLYFVVDLVTAVQELSRGEVSPETASLLQRLERNLPPGPPAVKICALNYDVELCNSIHLLNMPGKRYDHTTFHSVEYLYMCLCAHISLVSHT